MFVKVRGPGKRVETVTTTLSMQIKELKEKLANIFSVDPEDQRLTHRRKQLEDQYQLFDYGVKIGDLVLLTVNRIVIQKEAVTETKEPLSIEKRLRALPQISESKHFKVGEYVDFLDTHFGAWFQGKVKVIYVEDQARLDAISEETIPPTQRNGEREADYSNKGVGDKTKDAPAPSTLHRDSPVEISDDEVVDVVTVRSSSPESVIYIPSEEEPVIYLPPEDPDVQVIYEPEMYVPPAIYVAPYPRGVEAVDSVANTPMSNGNKQVELQEITCDQSSHKICAVSDTGGKRTVDSIGNTQRTNGSKKGVLQKKTCGRPSNKKKSVSDTNSKITGDTIGNTLRPNETRQEALQRALHEALQEMTYDLSSDRMNGVSDTDHSESGDSGHSSHMSLKNTSQSNGWAECEEASNQQALPDDGCLYEIINLNTIDQIDMLCKLSQVRPMSRKLLDITEIECGQTVLVNYSLDGTDKLGHWFDFKVSKVVNGSKKKWLEGIIHVLNWNPYEVTGVKITKVDMIWQIEKLTLRKQREDLCSAHNVQKRPVRAICDNCNDNPAAQCRACSCRVCGLKSEPSKQIMCDECDSPYHLWCLTPPLAEVPDVDQWFCHNCNAIANEILKAGEEPKVSKKRGRKPSVTNISSEVTSTSPEAISTSPKVKTRTSPKVKGTSPKVKTSTSPKVKGTSPKVKTSTSSKAMSVSHKVTSPSPKKSDIFPQVKRVHTIRRSMANASRTKMCTVVPSSHFGPIPGVEVGTTWRFRIQASEAGVHRPPVGGMHGREDIGAFSIVLSGGYEDDEDFGDWFWYTGAGGRDLSGNRRTTNRQTCDQTFTHTNKALALNCNTELSEEGGKAVDWRAGKPVRVLRSYKFRKRSIYAPEEGLRYDGIYKVVEYLPHRGCSGFIVWRYLLRRDDPTPAPWTEEGKRLIESLGLQIEYPENYSPTLSEKKSGRSSKKLEKSSKKPIEKPVTNENEENSLHMSVRTETVMNETEENNLHISIKTELSENYASIEESHMMDENEEGSLNKRIKPEPYEIDPRIADIIAKDEQNEELWQHCSFYVRDGKMKYLKAIQENFTCICCQELLYLPITTPCSHNVCLGCLQNSFQAEVYKCPTCKEDLPDSFPFVVNEHLFEALKAFFPGYRPSNGTVLHYS
ncbi:E3 ubiquitin-protein ligase UHRF1-like [Schistocerca americana]|uniref:E3 ubiquitin-protein ligase UHRF1-like n=1 Tax=Schistocerca americana TaxID=7009 RepID=UPI001F4FFF18|nr:E3 ubiquitin-protein ligase UHRF1-like [Schistocerca americana]